MDNAKEWQPDSDTVIIKEQTIIAGVSLKLHCQRIIDNLKCSNTFLGEQFIFSQLDELLRKSVGAQVCSALTLIEKEKKVFQNTTNRPKLARIIADKVRLYLDGKLADTAKEIAFRCIDNWLAGIEAQELTPPTTNEQATAPQLPSELEGARVFFERAVNAGYMTITATGAQWAKTKAMLGYFCMRAFDTSPRPLAVIEKYFNVRKLSSAITQASYEVKRADVIQWRSKMNSAIFFD